ncbi:TPA: transposase [Yersinia enterocolitica]|nr:hypothetical protein A499_06760 [Niallia nealsonii AAU1]HEO8418188.1 transposase [Yersinia enterocolitica]
MPRKAREKSSTKTYHIILRGANKQLIFHEEADRMNFLAILKKYKQRSEISIYAWCLMDNHVHLVIKEGNEDISDTMKRIGVSYVYYFNQKYKTNGPLFQDRFRSECVESTRYLLTVIRYIHQNPVQAGLVIYPDKWEWSSCSAYYGKKENSSTLLDNTEIMKMFSNEHGESKESFKAFNEAKHYDVCLEDKTGERIRLTDEQAVLEIKKIISPIEIPNVRKLPRETRNEIIRQINHQLKGLSQRQTARIFGMSPKVIQKALE